MQGDGYDTDYHPAAIHPPAKDSEPQPPSSTSDSAGATETSKKEGVSEKANEHPPRDASATSTSSDGQTKKKVGFMEKMKGEAKVLLGHLEGKKGEAKVEEGKRIKSGGATPAPAAGSKA